MGIDLNKFRKIFIKNNKFVSDIEYTSGNYDRDGNLIKKDLPTITTDYCEIGFYKNEVYFVFILKSKSFKRSLFDCIKDKSNMFIYGFLDFKTILYPRKNFNYEKFIKTINKDKYIQIQFDFRNIKQKDLFNVYLDLVSIFDKSKTKVINQLKINLVKNK